MRAVAQANGRNRIAILVPCHRVIGADGGLGGYGGGVWRKRRLLEIEGAKLSVRDPECRPGCAACCIAPSISSPIPGMPDGNVAGAVCVG